MNQRIRLLLDNVLQKKHHAERQDINPEVLNGFTASLKAQDLPDFVRAQNRLTWVLENEKPVILPGEKIVFARTVRKIPEIFAQDEWDLIKIEHYVHELGRVCNLNANYGYTIGAGLEKRRDEVKEAIAFHSSHGNRDGVEYLMTILKSVDDIEDLVHRYAQKALETGRRDIYDMLCRIPASGARTFHEALQFFRILHFTLWASGNYHNTVGRFDQYMLKYLEKDLETGLLDYDSAFELLEEFFISFNKDSDLYPGMQQGDNGQSLVLGGIDKDGNDAFNMLSEMCLKASLDLKLIDPKINLRVNRYTAIEKYDLGTELTRQGLGFPQYSNDEIVIPGLISRGYKPEDATDYVVAACWEFIIPGYGMDIPNICALSFARVVNETMNKYLAASMDFNSFMDKVRGEIRAELNEITGRLNNIYMEPAPFHSLLMNGCVEKAKDISLGAEYNNYGIHGTGLSTAADSLAAIKKYVFDEHSVSPLELVQAVESNFEGSDELWRRLKFDAPKMGNDDDYVDTIAIQLVNDFAGLTGCLKNERGGCFRAGPGSAMYYLWHAGETGASPDGRKKGEPLSANFSPSLNVKLDGPISIIRSFSKPDMKKIVNGGPLTLELHDTVFRNKESIRKVSSLVQSYMAMGGHQLQLNSLNRDRLIEAKKHPGLHKNLIVRVWGWSGYFVELDEVYQDHIIQRAELDI
jgi:pyruvate-formate lyase